MPIAWTRHSVRGAPEKKPGRRLPAQRTGKANTQTGHIEIRQVGIVRLPHSHLSNGQIQLRRQSVS